MIDKEYSAVPNVLVGSWSVEDIGGGGVVDGTRPAIDFGADGSVTGTTGLNRFVGRYDVVDGELRCPPLAMTRMAGPSEVIAQESALVRVLSAPAAIRRVVVIGDGTDAIRLVERTDAPPT